VIPIYWDGQQLSLSVTFKGVYAFSWMPRCSQRNGIQTILKEGFYSNWEMMLKDIILASYEGNES
jgi:hypothetical protein